MPKIRAILAFFVGVFVSVFVVTYAYLYATNAFSPEIKTVVGEFSVSPPKIEDSYAVLLLGRGGEGHSGGTLTDSNILINVDTKNKKVAMISIPRDLFLSLPTDFDNKTNHKFNEAYAIALNNLSYANKRPEFRGETGAGEFAKYAAEIVTNIKPDYYVSVDFNSFTKLIDLLGGVEVDSPRAWDDFFYPVRGLENETCGKSAQEFADLHTKYSGFELEKQFECRYEQIHFDKGVNKIDGEAALKFARSRHSVSYGGDFARSEKQLALLIGIKNKLISVNALKNSGKIVDRLFSLVRTDLEISKIMELAKIFVNHEDYEVTSIRLTEENVLNSSKNSAGAYILVPKEGFNKWSAIHRFILEGI